MQVLRRLHVLHCGVCMCTYFRPYSCVELFSAASSCYYIVSAVKKVLNINYILFIYSIWIYMGEGGNV